MKPTHINLLKTLIIVLETITIMILVITYPEVADLVVEESIIYSNIDTNKIVSAPLTISIVDDEYMFENQIELDSEYYQLFKEINSNNQLFSKIYNEYKVVIFFGDTSPSEYSEYFNTQVWTISLINPVDTITFVVDSNDLDSTTLNSLDSVLNGTESYAYCKLMIYDQNNNLIHVINNYIE